jgi:hypothetical protein
MLTRLLAVDGGTSPQSSWISVSVGTICPGLSRRHARSERHFAALMPAQLPSDQTSNGPSMRKRISQASPSERTISSAFGVAVVPGNAKRPPPGPFGPASSSGLLA